MLNVKSTRIYITHNNDKRVRHVVQSIFPHYSRGLHEVKREQRWPNQSLRSGSCGIRLENGDAILIGAGACHGMQGCVGFVSQRKACQELRKTGRMSP